MRSLAPLAAATLIGITTFTANAGVIEDRTQARISQRRYAYDEVMFKTKNICPTCKIDKPARSKLSIRGVAA